MSGGITGQGTTFNLPNFVGDLFNISPEDTPLLSAIGGLTGGKAVHAKRFEWQFYDLRAPGARGRVEGAAAPTAEARVRSTDFNVLQIIQEAVEVSYSKLGATGQTGAASLITGRNPVLDEMGWQVDQALKSIALDTNWSFINGVFAEPADNATPRRTRGLLSAITSNRVTLVSRADAGGDITGAIGSVATSAAAHGMAIGDRFQFTTLNGGAGLVVSTPYFVVAVPSTTTFSLATTPGGAPLAWTTAIATGSRISVFTRVTADAIGNAMQMAFASGGLQMGETRVALVSPLQKRRLTRALITDANYQEGNRHIGGVNLKTLETDFGTLTTMTDRSMPDGEIAFVSLEDLAPVFLEIPGKGHLFVEPLARVGAAERSQIYGEIGLEYGNERKHACISNAG